MMNMFNIENTQKKSKENILNDWDKNIFVEAVPNIVNKIMRDFNGKLPQIIILPETTARPLSYLLDPIFKKISAVNNSSSPKFIFFNVSRPDGTIDHLESYHDDNYQVSVEKAIEYIVNDLGETTDITGNQMSELAKQVKQTHEKRKHEQSRANEIQEKIGNQTIIIIDDFGNRGVAGGTMREITHAFGKKIPAYYLFASTWSESEPVKKAGKIFNFGSESYIPNPQTKHARLSFSLGPFRKSIGVEKDNNEKYAIPLRTKEDFTPEDQEFIGQLRKEMKVLGEEIAKNFKVEEIKTAE